MGATKIEWAERVWNPVTGCTPVSEGCANCYAKRQAKWLHGMKSPKYINGFAPTFHHKALLEITPKQKPAIIFVPSMSDLFQYEFSEYDPASQVINQMRFCSQHRFMLLTKRAGRARECLPYIYGHHAENILPNMALGVSAENQRWLEPRLNDLKNCPAAYRFLSLEPLLGPISLAGADPDWKHYIDLVIVGGESGPGARPMKPSWAWKLRDECLNAGVPFCFKQWGKWSPEPIFNPKPPKWPPPEGAIKRGKGLPTILFPNGEMTMKCGKKAAGRCLNGEIHDGKLIGGYDGYSGRIAERV